MSAANSNDKISEAANGGIPVAATVTAARAVAVTALSVSTQLYWPTTTGIKFSTYKTTTIGTTTVKVAGTQTDWKGVSNGSNTLSNIVAVGGAGDVGNAIGDVVEMGPTAQWGEDMAEAFLQEHVNNGSSSGQHGNINPGTVTASGLITGNGGLTVPTGQVANIMPALSNPYKFSAYLSTDQIIPASTWTKVTLDTKAFDTNSNFDSTTNHRFTAPVAGFYLISGQAQLTVSGLSTGITTQAGLFKNGTGLTYSGVIDGTGSTSRIPVGAMSGLYQLAAGDYIELFGFIGESSRAIGAGSQETFLCGYLMSAT